MRVKVNVWDQYSYLSVCWTCCCITFCVIHDRAVWANHTLYSSHLITLAACGSTLQAKKKEGGQLVTVSNLMLHNNAYALFCWISSDLRLSTMARWHQSSTDVISTRMGNLGRGPVICPPFSFSLSLFLIADLSATRSSLCGRICS